jgi:hypothetical protein
MQSKSAPARGFFNTCVRLPALAALFLAVAARAQVAPPLADFPTPLSSQLPYDVDVPTVRMLDDQNQIEQAQRLFDILSWQAFIALNWPAGPDGQPDPAKSISDNTSPRVWSYWRNADTIFLPNGAKPKRWDWASNALENGNVYRDKAAWRQHATGAPENFEAFAGPLVDQNGKWVRYEVMVNQEEFDYVVKNVLYNQEGQVAFSQKDDDNEVGFPLNKGTDKHGAIEIKLAWKELGPNDDTNRFLVAHINVTTSEPQAPGQTVPATRDFDAGLVGMHIAMRTVSSPEWIWATFEQIDNVRVNHYPDGRPTHPNFFNPSIQESNNVQPSMNAVLDPSTGFPVITNVNPTTWVESLTTNPVQVARVVVPTQGLLNPLDQSLLNDAAALNTNVQAILTQSNSVLQYYELIDTQWPVHPNAPAFAGGNSSAPGSIAHKTPGDIVPTFLINTTMETYFQKGYQFAGNVEQDDRLAPGSPTIDATMVTATESCIGCHYSSGICIGFQADTNGVIFRDSNGVPAPIYGENNHFGKTGGANFSWLLQLEPKSTNSPVAMAKYPAKFLNIGTH